MTAARRSLVIGPPPLLLSKDRNGASLPIRRTCTRGRALTGGEAAPLDQTWRASGGATCSVAWRPSNGHMCQQCVDWSSSVDRFVVISGCSSAGKTDSERRHGPDMALAEYSRLLRIYFEERADFVLRTLET